MGAECASVSTSATDARSRLSPRLAEIVAPLWTFLTVTEAPTRSDVIFVFGSQDLRVAGHAASLYNDGYAPAVLVSGHYGRMTREIFDKPEALVFKDHLVRSGVPPSSVVTECDARNTLENVVNGLDVLRRHGSRLSSVLLVAKPFVMRRCAATFAKHAPDVQMRCCPPTADIALSIDRAPDIFAMRLVAELERIDRYGENGDIEQQAVPQSVRIVTRRITDYVLRR